MFRFCLRYASCCARFTRRPSTAAGHAWAVRSFPSRILKVRGTAAEPRGPFGKTARVRVECPFVPSPSTLDWTFMAVEISLPTHPSTKSTGLEVWMDRVLEGAEKLQPDWDADDVHDLRVALR